MKTKAHGELELQVMNILWENQECGVHDVFNEIKKERAIAYTTVATILQRLHDKGLVYKKEDIKYYLYSPKLSKQEYSTQIAKNFIDKFVNSFGETAISSFAESVETLPDTSKKRLLKLIQEYEDTQQ